MNSTTMPDGGPNGTCIEQDMTTLLNMAPVFYFPQLVHQTQPNTSLGLTRFPYETNPLMPSVTDH